MVKDIVEPMFKEMLPGPLATLHFTKVDIGATPIKFAKCVVETLGDEDGKADSLELELDVIWDSDMDISLDANLLPSFGVRHVKFEGRLSVLLQPLMSRLPLVSAMSIALINPPELELDFTGAADVLDVTLIDSVIRNCIKDIVGNILCLPNRMLIKLDPLASIYETYQGPSHVLRLTIESGAGFKSTGCIIKDVPDCYVACRFGANPVVQTETKKNDETPEWNQSFDFLFSDNDQVISMDILDSDVGKDDLLGSAKTSVGKLMDEGKTATLPIYATDKETTEKKDSGATITISAVALKLVPDATSLEQPAVEGSSTCHGVLTVLVAGAKGLVGKREELKTQVALACGEQTGATPVVMDAPMVDTCNPSYDYVFRVLLTPEIVAAKDDVKLTLKNDGHSIGEYAFTVEEILGAPGLTMESEFPVASGGVLRAKAFIHGTE